VQVPQAAAYIGPLLARHLMPPLQMPPTGLAVYIGAAQAGHTFSGSGSGIVLSGSLTGHVRSRLTTPSSATAEQFAAHG
jgi:hypothetical protein